MPDPNGCPVCGRVECPTLAVEVPTVEVATCAVIDCDEHAVNWRALYFALAKAVRERLPRLRHGHEECCDKNLYPTSTDYAKAHPKDPYECQCGGDEHNARLDALQAMLDEVVP